VTTTATTTETVSAVPVTTEAPVELPAGIVARFHVTPAALDRALRIAMLAASTDNTLPLLNSVALTHTGANLAMMSTDRYRLVYALVATVTEDKSGPFPHVVETLSNPANPAIIPLADAKALATWVKPLIKALAGWGTLVVDVHRETASDHGGRLTVTAPTGSAYVVELTTGEYPRIAGLFPGHGVADPVGRFALNPTYMESVAKMAKLGCERNTPVEIMPGAGASKPVTFRGQSDGVTTFHGLIMPVRLPEGHEPATGLSL
jgi:hypothetical protein